MFLNEKHLKELKLWSFACYQYIAGFLSEGFLVILSYFIFSCQLFSTFMFFLEKILQFLTSIAWSPMSASTASGTTEKPFKHIASACCLKQADWKTELVVQATTSGGTLVQITASTTTPAAASRVNLMTLAARLLQRSRKSLASTGTTLPSDSTRRWFHQLPSPTVAVP